LGTHNNAAGRIASAASRRAILAHYIGTCEGSVRSLDASNILFSVAWFPTAIPQAKTPAYGDPERLTWGQFCEILSSRRVGPKDGPGFVPSRFDLDADGRRVRRKKINLVARTAVALDIEASKKTGEIPPCPGAAADIVRRLGLAAIVYTSHSHKAHDPRYRMVFPLSGEIGIDIDAPEIVAARLGLLGVLDASKEGAASFFYAPSCASEDDEHLTAVITGRALDAAKITAEGIKINEARKADAERIANEAQSAAAHRMAEKIAAGFDPTDSIIEKIRSKLDLDAILCAHGYEKSGQNFKHPNSSSSCFGANIKNFGGVERVFSHNATDPLHGDNLPAWCGGVTALDAFDVVAILDFNGDRNKAINAMAERFGLTKTAEKKELAKFIFKAIRRALPQDEIERASIEEGARLGFARDDVCRIAHWVVSQAMGVGEHANG